MNTTNCRNERIDLIRGIAILCVLILHFTLAYGIKDSPVGQLLPAWLIGSIVLNGNYGVTMFFTVSGFLITSNALARWGVLADIRLREFYLLRIARIMPPLLLALALIVTLGSMGLPFFSNTDNGRNLPASYFVIAAGSVLSFWHNVLMQREGYFNYCLNVFWSLSVEEMFYLVMPLICVSLRRPLALVVVCLAAIAYGPVFRAAHADNEIFFMYAYPACFDAIAMGCLAALAARQLTPAQGTTAVLRLLGALCLVGAYLCGIGGHEAEGFSAIAFFTAIFLFGTAREARMPPLAAGITRPLRWMGRHSYELYLFHIVVLALLRNLVGRNELSYATRLPWLALFIGLSCITATLVARHVSLPASRAIRRRL